MNTHHEKHQPSFACPMHPEMTAHAPDACCPKCGMKMAPAGGPHGAHPAGHDHGGHEHEGHDHATHHEMMARDFKQRFWIALLLAIPVLALSPSIQQWFGFSVPPFPGQNLLLFVLASVIALYAGWPFYKGALNDELRIGHWGMMTLVSLAVLTGYFYSVATTFWIEAPDFYWEISTLVLVLLLGHWLEMRAVVGA
ncbi:MAG: heavy metal translocating P-type ATPase, partial [Parcubacteria group bacterium]|nr:heavy metal translocating P-type ATPase [Parcubacteria group bacterium]